MTGQVVKCLSRECEVEQNGKRFVVALRGKLKQEPQSVLVGDFVDFDENLLVIERVLPRKNRLIRPFVANVDQVVVVVAEQPKPDLLVVDQAIIGAQKQELPVVLVVNKIDQNSQNFASEIKSDYDRVVNKIVEVSAASGEKISELKQLLKGKLSVLVGASGVGKSSLINALSTSAVQKTGDLSAKITRGKNTTRSNEIFSFNFGAKTIDSPGFSAFSLGTIEPAELARAYTDFAPYACHCAFTSCNHVSQTDCAVKQAVKSGQISKNRYERYCTLFEKYQADWQNRYRRKKEKNNENFTINNSRRLSKRTKTK